MASNTLLDVNIAAFSMVYCFLTPILLGIYLQSTKDVEVYVPQISILETLSVFLFSLTLTGVVRLKVSFNGWKRFVHLLPLLVAAASWLLLIIQFSRFNEYLKTSVVDYLLTTMGFIIVCLYRPTLTNRVKVIHISSVIFWMIFSGFITHLVENKVSYETILYAIVVRLFVLGEVLLFYSVLSHPSDEGEDTINFLHWYFIIALTGVFGFYFYIQFFKKTPEEETMIHQGVELV